MKIRTSGVTSRSIGGEVIVLDLDRSRYLTVSGSGTLLYEMLKDECSRDELIEGVVTRYEVDEGRAAEDVDRFLAELEEVGLLET